MQQRLCLLLLSILTLACSSDRSVLPSQLQARAATSLPAINTYDDLVTFIRTARMNGRPIRRIEDFLAAVKAEDPDFLYNHALVYSSRSMQAASPSRPRVILFGRDKANYPKTNLILAFNGDAQALGYDRLEVISFDPAKRQLAFKEIIFPGDHVSHPDTEAEVSFDDNPKSCATCHGSPAKPIWDTYPIWPGVYGSVEDYLYPLTPELTQFQNFLSEAPHLARYQHLGIDLVPDKLLDYTRNDTFRLVRRPNLKLTLALSSINFQRIAAELPQWPRYEQWKYGMLGVSSDCLYNRPGPYFPEAMASEANRRFEAFQADTTKRLEQGIVDKRRRLYQAHHMPGTFPDALSYLEFDRDRAAQVAGYQFYASLSGLSVDNWSMALTPASLLFSTGRNGLDDFNLILQDDARLDQELNNFIPRGSYNKVRCNELAAAAKNHLSQEGITALPPVQESLALDRQAPILRCAACHTQPYLDDKGVASLKPGKGAPYYPFHQPQELRQMLNDDPGLGPRMTARLRLAPHHALRMPRAPYRPLTTEEQDSVASFIETLQR